jgi:GTPase SAR1 family protein
MARTDANLHHVGVFGRRTCGKTTLLIEWVAGSYRNEGRYGVILDPKANEHNWGPHCWVTEDREKWLAKWRDPRCKNCNIVWEETATTLNRDRDFESVFTMEAGKHGHRLIISGHGWATLTRTMRQQITELYLFRQSPEEAEEWARLLMDRRILDACNLDHDKREFLHVRIGQTPRRRVLILKK